MADVFIQVNGISSVKKHKISIHHSEKPGQYRVIPVESTFRIDSGIAEAAGFQRGKGVFLAPQAIDSVEVLGTDGSIRFAPDIPLGIHEVKNVVIVTLDRFPVCTDAVTLRKLKVVGSEPL